MTFDLIALGETMMSVTPPPGEKLSEAATLVLDHGGAESNTCVGLARLGFRVAWVSRLGSDVFGDRVHQALQQEGIDTQWVRRDAHRQTGLMLKDPLGSGVSYYRAGSAASCLGPEDLQCVPLAEARAVLVTGITALIGPEPQKAAISMLDGARGLRVVDPNFRRGLWGSEQRVELTLPLVERCDLLLSGDQELAELTEADRFDEMARVCVGWGPREVVIRGAESVAVYTPSGLCAELETPRCESWDPMGAGDAFNAGYIAIRLRGGDIQRALRAAVKAGRAVAMCAGDTAGFPRTLED